MAEVEAGWDFSVLQRQGSFDQRGEPGRLFQVPDIRLERADRAESAPLRPGAERTGQRVDLKRITDCRARSMPKRRRDSCVSKLD